MEDAINDLSPCPVLEVAAEDKPRAWPPGSSWPRQWPSATARCAAGQVDAVVCPECGLRIAGELLTSKNSDIENAACTPEDKSLGVNPVP